MRRLSLLLHTVRYLKISQLAYNIFYRFYKPSFKPIPLPMLRNLLATWDGAYFMKPSTIDGKRFSFLGMEVTLGSDWNNASLPKLWLYNLHYQDDLNAIGADDREELCKRLIEKWIKENPPFIGNGWEPYCLSLRIVNWVKWLSRQRLNEVDPAVYHSLAQQAGALAKQPEYHILGNHLFANAKALVFVGSYLGGEEGNAWLAQGLELLDKQVAEQFLADGAHYELSPMYHAILLWDLADLLCLAASSKLKVFESKVSRWEQLFKKGIIWLQSMVHPDGEISFFNDAAFGIAPTLADLELYAERLGIQVPPPQTVSSVSGKLLQESGYCVIDWPSGHRLLVDVAKVGPNYQPGHAHADTLSFELSLFGQRVLVNSGISQYGQDAERQRQRGTAAHNTVEVDGVNSSEVWAGFRVGRRAFPYEVEFSSGTELVTIQACHNGYQRLKGRVSHRRCWLASQNSLIIKDSLEGQFSSAIAHWHFHPSVNVSVSDQDNILLRLADGREARLNFIGANAKLQYSSWHPEFGVIKPSYKLVLSMTGSELKTQISWSSD